MCILYLVSIFTVEYSVGVIYLVIQNLPQSVRYKTENIILIGIIPGPKEPKYTLNSFLRPLVEELKELWTGVDINCKYHPVGKVFVRAALTCCVCPQQERCVDLLGIQQL